MCICILWPFNPEKSRRCCATAQRAAVRAPAATDSGRQSLFGTTPGIFPVGRSIMGRPGLDWAGPPLVVGPGCVTIAPPPPSVNNRAPPTPSRRSSFLWWASPGENCQGRILFPVHPCLWLKDAVTTCPIGKPLSRKYYCPYCTIVYVVMS